MNSIHKKIWMLTTILIVTMVVIWVALTFYNQKMQDQYNHILERYISLNEVTVASQELITDLNNYLLQPDTDSLKAVYASSDNVNHAQTKVADLRNVENDFTLTNYMHLIESLMETTDRLLMFHDQKETEASAREFTEASRISNYISEMTLSLLDSELKTYDGFYRGIINQSEEFNRLGIFTLLLITFLLLVMSYWLSLTISRPVQQLTQAANELSSGKFDREIKVNSNDEIFFLAKTFDSMRVNINNLISEIKQKAKLENELKENKILLQESQFRSLQSQINPHFLFNTLNTLSKKAYMEGSEETSDLLVSVAGLLRYNLKRIDRAVTIFDEVVVLQQYMDIQQARFTDRLAFHLEVDESCYNVQIPALTLQPIIENAVIHAIEPKEEGGVIWFRLMKVDNQVRMEIEDDGEGMSQENIKQVLEEQTVQTEGHSTGIGFSNVVKRIRIFYGDDNVIGIESVKGSGTKVVIEIPEKRRGMYDKALDRG